jgi:hypothetical protein
VLAVMVVTDWSASGLGRWKSLLMLLMLPDNLFGQMDPIHGPDVLVRHPGGRQSSGGGISELGYPIPSTDNATLRTSTAPELALETSGLVPPQSGLLDIRGLASTEFHQLGWPGNKLLSSTVLVGSTVGRSFQHFK